MPVSEDELKKIAVAPRVTKEQVEEAIAFEHYFRASEGVIGAFRNKEPVEIPQSLQLMTFCVLTLKNGWTVTGKSSCASPANYNQAIGERLSRDDAVGQLWAFLGFELKTKLALVAQGTAPSYAQARTYIGTKVVHAFPMNRASYNALRGWVLPVDENGEDEGYLVEYADGGRTNLADFMGYVSWSPKDVFERSYRELGA